MTKAAKLSAPLQNLFRRETEEGRRGRVEHREVEVDLAPVVNLVLDNRPQSLPDGDVRPARRDAFLQKVFVAQPAEYLQRLRVHLLDELDRGLVAVGQFLTVSGVAA